MSAPPDGSAGESGDASAAAPIGRLGRLFIDAVRLDHMPPEIALREGRAALREGVGGFILFGGGAEDARRVIGELRSAAEWPLLIAADLERGAGQQFAGASTLPPPAALARHPEAETAVRTAARVTARGCRELGIDWVFAPVLDLDVEPRNPIVGTRSFGSEPERVARLGRLWIEACQEAGVAACAKHFPGHGRTTADSHLEMPVVKASREALEDDLLPFREVRGDVAGMMTAHVAYPALCGGDSPEAALHEDTPATLNRLILRRLLREEIGFGGLVITDALIMDALGTGAGAAAEGWLAVRALRAGCDLLLYPSDLALAVRTVRQAAENDARLLEIAGRALKRRASVLERFGSGASGGRSAAPESGVDREDPDLDALGAACIRATGEPPGEILSRAGPIRLRVLSDDPAGGTEGLGEALATSLGARGWRLESGEIADGEGAASGAEDGPGADLVLLEATPRAWKGRASISSETTARLRSALGGAGTGYLIVCGHLRLLEELGVPGACAWSAEPVMERAVARWLDARVGDGARG